MLFEFLISARLINSGRLWNTNNTISDIFSDIQRINFSKASTSRLKLKLLSLRNNSGRQCGIIQLRQRLLGCRRFERVNVPPHISARAIITLFTFVRTDTTYRWFIRSPKIPKFSLSTYCQRKNPSFQPQYPVFRTRRLNVLWKWIRWFWIALGSALVVLSSVSLCQASTITLHLSAQFRHIQAIYSQLTMTSAADSIRVFGRQEI